MEAPLQIDRALLEEVLALAQHAGTLVLEHYGAKSLTVHDKGDGSPLTSADLASHHYLVGELERRFRLPVVSEESETVSIAPDHRRFWLVDPLDGTKDFVERTDDFCVLIALIEDQKPCLGVIVAPARAQSWAAIRGGGALRVEGPRFVPIRNTRSDQPLVGLDSRFHSSAEVQAFFAANGVADIRRCGSAVKYGRLAESEADVYPCFASIREWDTAAGQLLIEEAGCQLRTRGGDELRYGKPDCRNPPFLAMSARFARSMT